jgi:hypothetical protein
MRNVDMSFKEAFMFDEESDFKSFAKACGYMVSPEDPFKIVKDTMVNERQRTESFAKYCQRSRLTFMDALRGEESRCSFMKMSLVERIIRDLPRVPLPRAPLPVPKPPVE